MVKNKNKIKQFKFTKFTTKQKDNIFLKCKMP